MINLLKICYFAHGERMKENGKVTSKDTVVLFGSTMSRSDLF